jgi:hypothetical protein
MTVLVEYFASLEVREVEGVIDTLSPSVRVP